MKFYYFLLFLFLLLLVFNLASIEVGGNLTEDTTWSPDNNPYLVTGVVYIESDVTLTILPGTIIKFNDALLNYINNDEFWYMNGEEPLVKYIKCYGNIIAEGTEQDSIIFTRMHDIDNYHWGTIYLTPGSSLSVFKYCHFEYSAFIGISMMEQPEGAILVDNGLLKAESCSFIDNLVAIKVEGYSHDILIKDCDFKLIGPLLNNQNYKSIWGLDWDGFEADNMLIAHNTTNEKIIMTGIPVNVIFNYANYEFGDHSSIKISTHNRKSYVFGNHITNYFRGLLSTDADTLFIRANVFSSSSRGVEIDEAYTEISHNFFLESDLYTGIDCYGKVFNNYVINDYLRAPGYMEVFNNIQTNTDYGHGSLIVSWRNISCYNNLSLGNSYALCSGGTVLYENCIIVLSEELNNFPISDNPTFRNCIIDFPLDPPLIDAGGNIIIDSLQAQEIFVDIQNGDYHLAPSSIAIDAGFDTLGYYYPFDIDYNYRKWDGDNNGSVIIDIGPYEFESPDLGGIEGITYDPTNGDFVDYVIIKINNEPGEFTFSDSIGSYQYKLPVGVYDVYAERVFYDDAVEYHIEVVDGQFTQLDIPMCETVSVQNYEIIPVANNFHLYNFPNPFNPTTTINFSIPISNNVELSIYNIKGQHITTLINEHVSKGKHSIIWSGYDENGNFVGSGIYLYKIKVGNHEFVKRMLLLK